MQSQIESARLLEPADAIPFILRKQPNCTNECSLERERMINHEKTPIR